MSQDFKITFQKLQNNMAIILCMYVFVCVCVCVCMHACMRGCLLIVYNMHPHAHTLSELTDFVVELSSG